MTQHSKQLQQQKQEQRQTLSQQQLLFVRLLELPTEGIEERIRTEVLENPALEEEERNDSAETANRETIEDNPTAEELTRGDYQNEEDIPDYAFGSGVVKNLAAEDIPLTDTKSSLDILNEQLGECSLNAEEHEVAEYLIGSLDDDGLLRKPLLAIKDELMIYYGIYRSEEQIIDILKIIQQFEPAGIGARNLQECLSIQLKRKPTSPSRTAALDIIEKCYDDFTYKRWGRIKQQLQLDEESLQQAISELTHLNPKPGNSIGESMDKRLQHITPDFIIETDSEGRIMFTLNEGNIPQLRICNSFQSMANEYALKEKEEKQKRSNDALIFLKQKIDSAQGFIDAIKQRQQTLIATMQAIIEIQHDFFLEGDEQLLKPMKLRDIADRTGLDVSTVSRVSNCKYAQTDYGIFPLKFFFGDSFHKPNSSQTEYDKAGSSQQPNDELSIRNIRNAIQEAIENEDAQNPLTDEQLVEILQQKGIDIARRTVAKHRNQLGYPVARMRK